MSIVKGIPAYLINRDKRKNTPHFFTVKISRNSWQKKLQRGESR
jgi:hypothetical protein